MESNPKFHDFQNHTCADAVVILTNYIPYKIITLDNYYNGVFIIFIILLFFCTNFSF